MQSQMKQTWYTGIFTAEKRVTTAIDKRGDNLIRGKPEGAAF